MTRSSQNALVSTKEKISFTPTQNCVYRWSALHCDVFYVRESSCEISTRARKDLGYTKRPLNNLVELENLQIRLAVAAHAMYNNYQAETTNIHIIQKGFSDSKEKWITESSQVILDLSVLREKKTLLFTQLESIIQTITFKSVHSSYN